MNLPIRPIAAASVFAMAVPASAAVEVQTTGPVVELSVTETVKSTPDRATVGAGVTTTAATAVEAMRLNAAEMTKVIARIRELGIAEKDIQTTGVTLYPQYDYDPEGQRQVFRGYQASNRVSLVLNDVARTGPVLDALVAAGATDVTGPEFSVADDSAAKQQAREAALRRAEAMARDYARWSGYSGISLLQVSESFYSEVPMPMMKVEAMAVAADAISTPIAPGMVGSSVTITVTYGMTR